MATTGLTVAVTGPTGDLGLGVVDALERSRAVKRVVGMARRPFDPGERGWRKAEYRQGDVTDASSVRELVAGADVVVHLAFAILGASDAARELNVAGSRRVFEESPRRGGAHLLRVERGRLRLRRQPRRDRGRAPARPRPSIPTPSRRPRWSRCWARCCSSTPAQWRMPSRPCIVAGPEALTMLQRLLLPPG